MVEFHCLWNLPMAKKLARLLEPYAPTWIRGPDPHERAAGTWRSWPVPPTFGSAPARRLAAATRIRRCWTATRSSVVMADLCWTGGLTEGRKIAALADTYHKPVRTA